MTYLTYIYMIIDVTTPLEALGNGVQGLSVATFTSQPVSIKSATTTVSSEPAGPLLDRIVVLQQFVGPGEGDLRSWIVAQGEGHFADAAPGGETDRRACPVGFGAPPHQVPVP